jgi:predicted SAM-dependent methyltransferase
MSAGWRGWFAADAKRGTAGAAGGSGNGSESVPGARLNVGCGRFPLAGWINLDIQALPTVDRVVDVRDGLPFRDAAAVYAEHFLEHLTFVEALDFLAVAHAALAPGGKLRLSTPNLEWVWATHDPAWPEEAEARRRTFVANRAFYGWQHRFIWTRPLLAEAMAASGFEKVTFHRYGESDDPALAGLEQHDVYPDSPDKPHVLIVEGSRGALDPARHERLLTAARESFLDHLRG